MSGRARRYMSKRDRACDPCRAKKAACRIDRSPPCYICTLHRKECTFMQPTARTRQPFSNTIYPVFSEDELDPCSRLHEDPPVGNSADGNLMAIDDGANNPAAGLSEGFTGLFDRSEASIAGVFDDGTWASGFSPGNFFHTSPQLPRIRHWTDEESPHATCRAVPTERDGPSVCLDTQDSMTAQFLGSTGDMDPLLISQYQYNSFGAFHFKNLSIQSVSSGFNPTQFLMSKPSIFSASRGKNGCDEVSTLELRQKLESLVPADIGIRLISLFDRIVIPQYPMLGPLDQLNPNTTPPYLLASAYLIVEPFTKFDEKLCIDLAYDKPSAVALHQVINEAMPFEIHAPKLCIIRTLLTLVIRPYPNPIVLDSGFKWSQLATIIACAHTLGLHLDPSSWQISSWEIFERRCLSCLIYSTDKWLALSLGRPALLHYDNWLVTSLSQNDILLAVLTLWLGQKL